MLAHCNLVLAILLGYANAADVSLHAQQPLASEERTTGIRLPLQNVEDWVFTTTVGLGTPPQNFTLLVDLAWSDLFVPSYGCLDIPSSTCWPHPLFESYQSSSFRATDRRSKVNRAGYYTSGDVAEDILHLGSVSVPGQVFEQTDDYRPTYIFNTSWYDASLGLSRRTVKSDDSDLQANSPFQNLIEQKMLPHNRFSLVLPRTLAETGELVIGGGDDALIDEHQSLGELAVQSSQSDTFKYELHHSQSHIQRTQFTSGGWEVQPISVTWGNLTFDLSTYTAVFCTARFWLDLPYDFASPMRDELGVSIWDGSIDCEARSAGWPDLVFAFRGFDGTVVEFSMTPEEYIRKSPVQIIIDPSNECQVPIAMHHDQDYNGDELPRFLILGSIFLRKYLSVFDADRESITLTAR